MLSVFVFRVFDVTREVLECLQVHNACWARENFETLTKFSEDAASARAGSVARGLSPKFA
jgi:hypothetical protein